jgi:hypothetical protein
MAGVTYMPFHLPDATEIALTQNLYNKNPSMQYILCNYTRDTACQVFLSFSQSGTGSLVALCVATNEKYVLQ